jgi:hypothetical protein
VGPLDGLGPDRRDAVRSVQELEQARVQLASQLQELTNARAHLERGELDEMAGLVKQQSKIATQETEALAVLDRALQGELAKTGARRKQLDGQESGVLENALKEFQAERLAHMLEAFRVSDAVLPGIINRELKQRLAQHGFVTAADVATFQVNVLNARRRFCLVNRRGVAVFVEGLSPERGVALILWRRTMEARAKKLVPGALPAEMETQLRKKFQDELVTLQLAELKKKQETQTTKTRLTESARKENERLTRAMQALPATYRRKTETTEQSLAEIRKTLAEKEWTLVLARRRLETYAHINFYNYLKSIFGL